jgi:hypothetical protein
MQNEFEKQVRQKMEELNFVPTEPVWEKIEAQIREKKDRKTIIFWLPLLALLLCGGWWWLNSTHDSNVGTIGNSHASLSSAHQKTNDQRTDAINGHTTADQSSLTTKENQEVDPVIKPAGNTTNNIAGNTALVAQQPGKYTAAKQAKDVRIQKNSAARVKVQKSIPVNEGSAALPKGIEGEKPSTVSNEKADPVAPLAPVIINQAETPVNRQEGINKTNELKPAPDSKALPHDTAKAAAPKKLYAFLPAPWRIGVVASMGMSSSGYGLKIFSNENNADMMYASPTTIRPPLARHTAPSPEHGDISYSFGIVAKKAVSQHVEVVTGLEYKFYSTRIEVGYKVAQNGLMNVTMNASQYYINNGTEYYKYYNKFHFISLPLAINYRFRKHHPVFAHGGVSVQQLVKTTALQYDYNAQVYYFDKNSINKTQLFTTLGADFTVIDKRTSLLVGPQVDYGISSFEKSEGKHHLFAFGLRAQYFFAKK